MEEFTLEEMLMQDTRKTIISNADMLGIRINKSHRKAGITMSQEELNKIWENEFQPPKGKVGRNAPCLCGSGRKYKNCCLKSN